MDSNIIKFTSITEGESSYSVDLSMPFTGISVDEENKPVSQLTYTCEISVMKGTSKLTPSNTATIGTYKIQLVTSSVSGLKNISADNANGRILFTTDPLNVLSNGDIEFQILLEDVNNSVTKTIGFTALQGLQGSDGLTYSFDYDNGMLVKYKNGNLFEYSPKIFRIAGYRRQGTEAREKLTNLDCNLSASITVNNTEISVPISWDSTNQVFFISFEDQTVITVGSVTDYITHFNIRKLNINIYDTNNVLLEHLGFDVNYGTSDDAASLVLNPTSIIGAIQNTKIGFTSEGLDIFRGGLRIFQGISASSEKVLVADQNGNLKVRGSIETGSAMAGWAIREHTMISGSGLVGIGDGNVNSPVEDYSFWAGHQDPNQAPFSVKKTGEMKAALLEIGGTQITQGTIRTGAFAPGAVDHDALGEDAVDSVNIRQGAVITEHLYANSVTVDKLAADVAQNLDLSTNQTMNLMAGDLRDEIKYAQDNAYGQTLTITFTNGNAFEYGKSNLEIAAHVWKNGEDITDQIPAGAFLWQRDSGNTTADTTWNLRSDHRHRKSIILPRDEIGTSCVIRCICDETSIYPVVSHANNGSVYLTTIEGGITDTFQITNGNLITSGDNYSLNDGYLFVETITEYLQTESTAFDHSMLLSSHISIKDDKIDVASGGDINLLAGADLNVQATANINVAANGNINISNRGHLNVASGGDISLQSGGSLNILSGGNINVANDGSITVASGGSIAISSGGNLTISSGGKLFIAASDIMISNNESVQDEINRLDLDVGTADTKATNAQNDATNAQTAAGNAAAAAANANSLAQTANSSANTALNTANGKSKTFVQNTRPTSGYAEGDIWEDSGNNYREYTAIGNTGVPANDWVLISAGRIKGAAITGDFDTGILSIAASKKLSIASGGTLELAGNNSVTIGSGGTVTLAGANLQVKSSGNIDIQSGGNFTVDAGGVIQIYSTDNNSYIKLGGTATDPDFIVNKGGSVTARSVTTEDLTVKNVTFLTALNGTLASRYIVSTSKPSGHGILWFQPSSTSTVDYTFTSQDGSTKTFNGSSASNTATFNKSGSARLTGTKATYGIYFRIYSWGARVKWTNVTVQLSGTNTNGNNVTITIYNQNPNIWTEKDGSYVTIDSRNNPSGELDNLTNNGAITVTISVTKSGSAQARMEKGNQFILRCQNDSTASDQICTVHYLQ